MATPCAARINAQEVEPSDNLTGEAKEFLTSEKSSPLKSGGSSQNLVQAANLIQAVKQLDPATASLEARLKRLEDALQRPLALGEFED